MSESEQTKFGKEPFVTQSIPQKVFSSIWAVEGEVNNGGFEQYFINSSAETARFVVEAFNTIGAPKTADICRRAIAIAFPSGLPSDAASISDSSSDFSDDIREKLSALDNEFFAYPHNLTELLFAYVSKFPEEFGTLPSPTES